MTITCKRPLTAEERNSLSDFSDVLAHLLFHRGIKTNEEAKKFISPSYDRDLHDPFLLKDMDKAVARIVDAIKKKEKITIYADYDADGIPGAALFHGFFSLVGFKDFTIYIPHRHDEGFGVNENAVRKIAADGTRLMITLDCGITDVGPINLAKSLGIDVIISDHHEPPAIMPEALAIIDPKKSDCDYPDKNLCGAGVAFKLIQAILIKERFGIKEGQEKWLLDVVGIATLSDMVPLLGENRALAHYGLAVLRKTRRKGLVRLFAHLRMMQSVLTEDDVAFMITPRINAASRMGVPRDALDMLTAETDEDAERSVKHLDKINNERKGIVAALVKEVKKIVRERHGADMPNVIALGNPSWRPALLGLAANSCAEEFSRPVFLWGRDGDNMIKGSCRSEGKTNVVELMRAVKPGVFTQFGGHKHSGGFTVSDQEIHHFELVLREAANITSSPTPHDGDVVSIPVSSVSEDELPDLELRIEDVEPNLYENIIKLSPFGIGNTKPRFLFRGIKIFSMRTFGKTNDHIELRFKNDSGREVKAISFFGGSSEWVSKMKSGDVIDMVASLEKSYFNSRPELRLRIEDVSLSV